MNDKYIIYGKTVQMCLFDAVMKWLKKYWNMEFVCSQYQRGICCELDMDTLVAMETVVAIFTMQTKQKIIRNILHTPNWLYMFL